MSINREKPEIIYPIKEEKLMDFPIDEQPGEYIFNTSLFTRKNNNDLDNNKFDGHNTATFP